MVLISILCNVILVLLRYSSCLFSLDNEEQNIRIKRCVCHSYTVMLLLLIVRGATHAHYLQNACAKLLHFTKQGKGKFIIGDSRGGSV